jgi:dihydroorotate dehydrogenase
MKEVIVKTRNRVIGFLYRNVLKHLLFQFDPEKIHDFFVGTGKFLGSNVLTRAITGWMFRYSNPILKQTIYGIDFANPIGLAAGFDKNAEITKIVAKVGFGFAELGSFTGDLCHGNQKPRIWRLKKSKSLVVNYGLKNKGAEEISTRLEKISDQGHFAIPIGINIAKTNCAATADDSVGIADYVKGYKAFQVIGDYYTINISCPNAYGGQPFTDAKRLDLLLTELDKYYVEGKPVFLKFSPDLSHHEVDQLLEVCEKHQVDGFICSNLTKVRDYQKITDRKVPEVGGISGKLVQGLADDLIEYVYKKTKGKKVIIGVGGVFSAVDAYHKIKHGASLVQLVTGMIFEGPQLISSINQGLVRLLKKDGYKSVAEAVGADVKL